MAAPTSSVTLGGEPVPAILCDFQFFQDRPPVDPSSMTRWRKCISPEGMETVLAAHPTDSGLYLKALRNLVRQAQPHGVILRRSHTRVAKRAPP